MTSLNFVEFFAREVQKYHTADNFTNIFRLIRQVKNLKNESNNLFDSNLPLKTDSDSDPFSLIR